MKHLIIVLSFFFIFISPGFSWEKYDRVMATVNNNPVVESEVLQRLKFSGKRNNARNRSRMLDSIIADHLVREKAEEEAISITNKRLVAQLSPFLHKFFGGIYKDKKKVDEAVENVGKDIDEYISAGLGEKIKTSSDFKRFKNFIEKKEHKSFREFFESLRRRITREQVMSVAIGGTPPTKQKAKAWYRKNRRKLGFEVHVKNILILPKSSSLSAERAANAKIAKIRKQILGGKSFESMARKYSQDRSSAARGGDMGWQMLGQLDPYFARQVFYMKRRGSVSRVFKSRRGYHIVKFLGKRAVSFAKVEKMILYKLYSEGLEERYKKWIREERKKADIKIYMKNYKKG